MLKVSMVAAATLFAMISTAAAWTCEEQAAVCVKKGGTPATCNDPARMASCAKTKKYVGPSGAVWNASGVPHDKYNH
jgi:hypothetical protein